MSVNKSLKQFYGMKSNEEPVCDPFDMKSQDFNADLFLNRVILFLNYLI